MTSKSLLEKAKAGPLSPSEIASVAQELSASGGVADKYTLIHILGRAGAVQYEEEVARHLHYEADPMVARMALKVLCSHWNKAKDYFDEIEAFVRGVDWDEDGDIRLAAISIAGELARNHELRFVPLLITIFRADGGDPIARQAAYFALARAAGMDWQELPPASRRLDMASEADPRVLDWITERANSHTN